MSADQNVVIGTVVSIQAMVPLDTYSVAGVQTKLVVRAVNVTGRVRHLRGDAPTAEECTRIGVWVECPEPGDYDNLSEVTRHFCEKCRVWEIGPFDAHKSIKAILPEKS